MAEFNRPRRQTDRQIDKSTDRQTDGPTRQTDRRTGYFVFYVMCSRAMLVHARQKLYTYEYILPPICNFCKSLSTDAIFVRR